MRCLRGEDRGRGSARAFPAASARALPGLDGLV